MVDSSAEANLCIKVLGLDDFGGVSLQRPPWLYVSAQSSPILEQCPPPVQANPHPGPLDSCSDISYREVMNNTCSWEQKMKEREKNRRQPGMPTISEQMFFLKNMLVLYNWAFQLFW